MRSSLTLFVFYLAVSSASALKPGHQALFCCLAATLVVSLTDESRIETQVLGKDYQGREDVVSWVEVNMGKGRGTPDILVFEYASW